MPIETVKLSARKNIHPSICRAHWIRWTLLKGSLERIHSQAGTPHQPGPVRTSRYLNPDRTLKLNTRLISSFLSFFFGVELFGIVVSTVANLKPSGNRSRTLAGGQRLVPSCRWLIKIPGSRRHGSHQPRRCPPFRAQPHPRGAEGRGGEPQPGVFHALLSLTGWPFELLLFSDVIGGPEYRVIHGDCAFLCWLSDEVLTSLIASILSLI